MVPCLTCPHKWSRPRPLTRRRAHLCSPTPAGTILLYVCIQHVFQSTSGIYLPSGLKNHQGQPVLLLEMMQCQNVSLHVVAPRRDEDLHQADAMRSPQRSPVKQHLLKTPPPGMPLPPPATTPLPATPVPISSSIGSVAPQTAASQATVNQQSAGPSSQVSVILCYSINSLLHVLSWQVSAAERTAVKENMSAMLHACC